MENVVGEQGLALATFSIQTLLTFLKFKPSQNLILKVEARVFKLGYFDVSGMLFPFLGP